MKKVTPKILYIWHLWYMYVSLCVSIKSCQHVVRSFFPSLFSIKIELFLLQKHIIQNTLSLRGGARGYTLNFEERPWTWRLVRCVGTWWWWKVWVEVGGRVGGGSGKGWMRVETAEWEESSWGEAWMDVEHIEKANGSMGGNANGWEEGEGVFLLPHGIHTSFHRNKKNPI